MVTVTDLAKHILLLQPQKEAARLALYHYLINHCDPDQELKTETINRFIQRTLIYDHWQKHRPLLQGEIEGILQSFSDSHMVQFSQAQILWPNDTQVVRIEKPHNMRLIVETDLEKWAPESSKIQVLIERNERVVALHLKADHSFDVHVYPAVAFIRNGELKPLCHDQRLSYDRNLQFKAGALQHCPTDANTTARFRMTPEGCIGKTIKGYTFQKGEILDGGKLNRFPYLFYPVKRLEQLFINRKTDPMYIELIQTLEKAVDLVRTQHPEAAKFAKAAFDRGKLALDQIFPDDNLLRLLINTLEVVVRSGQGAPRTFTPSSNSSNELLTRDQEPWDIQDIPIV